MATDASWQPFGVNQEDVPEQVIEHANGKRYAFDNFREIAGVHLEGKDRPPGSMLVSAATVLLGLLAAGLFVVSLAAQYRYVLAEKHQAGPAVLEATGLDVGMTIFALMALGLAMAGQSARIERALIIACALGSAAMNYAAANDGSPRSVAAYVMPPIFLAIVVDRVIAVVRRHVLGDSESSAWAVFGRFALYALRFALALPSTAKGLRRQVLILTPLPRTSAAALPGSAGVHPGPGPQKPPQPRSSRGESKTARFLALVEERHGELAAIDPAKASRIASDLAPEVGLNVGSARAALLPRVRAAHNGGAS